MKIHHYRDVSSEPLEDPGADGVLRRVVIGEAEGASNFIMRVFEVTPGGHTPRHRHDFEHEVFVLGGSGICLHSGGKAPVAAGSVLFIPGGEEHQFQNTGKDTLEFICLVPRHQTRPSRSA